MCMYVGTLHTGTYIHRAGPESGELFEARDYG